MILCEFDLYCYALVLCGLYRNNKTKHCAFDLKSVMKSKQIFYLHLLGSGLVIVVHTRQYTERQWITALICEPVAINCLVNLDFDNIIEWWGRLVCRLKIQCSVFKHWTPGFKCQKYVWSISSKCYCLKIITEKQCLNNMFWNMAGGDFK